jgi:spermidine synthase
MPKNSKFVLLFAIALIGTAAITSQVLLIREIVNLFAGNELLYGLTIFLWLILYAIGSAGVGRFAKVLKHKLNAFILTQGAIMLLLPSEILFSRFTKIFFKIPLGITIDLTHTILIMLLILAPITILLGFQFALASILLSEAFKKDSSQIGRVYILEAIGAIAGGLVLTYYLLYYFNAFQIAAVLIILISTSLLALGKVMGKKNTFSISAGILAFAVLLLLSAGYFDFDATQLSWQNYHLIETADSPYGRISITKDQDSLSFFENGGLFFSTADEVGKEEIAHLSMLLHPRPKDVLLIGGGVSEITNELLKYKLKSLDYVELDYKMVELAEKHIKFAPGVKIFTTDGITYLQETDKKYDLVIINLPNPSTTLINRFYTLEFFELCKKRLLKGGIVTFTLETSESFIGKELQHLNQSIYKTFAEVFAQTAVIPGNSNYYFGSERWFTSYRWPLLTRWRQRNIKTKYFDSTNLNYILWPNKIKYVRDTIQFDESTPINTNLRPISYYLELLVWSSYFYSPIKSFFYRLMNIPFSFFLGFLVMALIAVKLISVKVKRMVLPTIIILIGFTGMCVQLIIIYTFQSLHGYVYQVIGLLTAAFMGGLTLGSLLTHATHKKIKNPLFILRIILGILLALVAILFINLKEFPLPLASFLISLPIGAAFPLAVKIYEKYKKEIGSLAGILYGSDLFGGALAAVVTTIFFIPIFGVVQTFMIAIVFGVASLIISYS